MPLTNKLKQVRTQIDSCLLSEFTNVNDLRQELIQAVEYTFIGAGKAIRPFLVLTISDLLGVNPLYAKQIALALEMVHTYSLIHDDLPAMDNDTLRRGKPTCHIHFSESTAILTGDLLLTKAFEILSDEKTHPDATIRCKLITLLSKSAGINGMIGGQIIDLSAEKNPLTEKEIYFMQSLKTGALLEFACIAPGIVANASSTILTALKEYAHAIGLLFQITDDLLDETGDEKTVGKTLKKDKNAHKSTLLSIYGKEKTIELAKKLHIQALEALTVSPLNKNPSLKELADFILTRSY